MPSLSSRGRGRGLGKEFYWNEDNILNQAKAIHDLLKLDRQHETVLTYLWFIGFNIDAEKFKNAYIARYTNMVSPFRERIESANEPEDALSDISRPHTGKFAKIFNLERKNIEQGMIAFYELMLMPNTAIDSYYIGEDIATALQKLFPSQELEKFLPTIDLMPALYFIQKVMGLEGLRVLFGNAKNEELELIQKFWIKLWEHFCPVLLSNIPYYDKPGDYFTPKQYLSVYFGRGAVPLLLHLLNSGGASKLERTISEIIDFSDKYDFRNFLSEIDNFQNMSPIRLGELMEFADKILRGWNVSLFSPPSQPVLE